MSVVSRRWDLSSLFPGGTILPPELRTPRARDGYRHPRRGDRSSACLGHKPNIVPPRKQAQAGIRTQRVGVRFPDPLLPISSSQGGNIVRSGKFAATEYRPAQENISFSLGSFIVLPGNGSRPPWEGISSSPGKNIVLLRKAYRPDQETLTRFCLQICCFVVAPESHALYLFLLNVYCVSYTKAQRSFVTSTQLVPGFLGKT
jgi:hypothetical protein